MCCFVDAILQGRKSTWRYIWNQVFTTSDGNIRILLRMDLQLILLNST